MNIRELKAQGGQIVKARPGSEEIKAYFGLEGVAFALKASNWEVREEVERLVDFSRDADPKIAMQAMKQLRGVVRETAEINGIIQSQNAEITHSEGSHTVRISSSSKLVQSMKESVGHVEVPDSLPFAAQYYPAAGDSSAPEADV